MKKDIVIGLGEIGMPIYKKLSKFLQIIVLNSIFYTIAIEVYKKKLKLNK